MSHGVGRRCGSDPAWLWLWGRPAAAALICPRAWEPPCAAGVALKTHAHENSGIISWVSSYTGFRHTLGSHPRASALSNLTVFSPVRSSVTGTAVGRGCSGKPRRFPAEGGLVGSGRTSRRAQEQASGRARWGEERRIPGGGGPSTSRGRKAGSTRQARGAPPPPAQSRKAGGAGLGTWEKRRRLACLQHPELTPRGPRTRQVDRQATTAALPWPGPVLSSIKHASQAAVAGTWCNESRNTARGRQDLF